MAKKKETNSEVQSTRIELSVAEYNVMQEKIKGLEEEVLRLEERNLKLVTKLEKLLEAFNYLVDTPLPHRLMSWKRTVSIAEEHLEED